MAVLSERHLMAIRQHFAEQHPAAVFDTCNVHYAGNEPPEPQAMDFPATPRAAAQAVCRLCGQRFPIGPTPTETHGETQTFSGLPPSFATKPMAKEAEPSAT
jgi:hypothetical protein